MTPEEKLKQLAEFAHEFLNLKDANHVLENYQRYLSWPTPKDPEQVFDGWVAPILAHLALKEIDRREWEYSCGSKIRIHGDGQRKIIYWARVLKITRNEADSITDLEPFEIEDENTFIALWSAIMEAEEK